MIYNNFSDSNSNNINSNFVNSDFFYDDLSLDNSINSYWPNEKRITLFPKNFTSYGTKNETNNDLNINEESHIPQEKNNNENRDNNANDNIYNDDSILLNKKRKLGRKKKEEKNNIIDNNNCHTKYRKDNLQRKLKYISIDSCFKYINEYLLDKIYCQKYNSRKEYEYRLIKINHELIRNIKTDYNKKLLEQKMRWIFTQTKCKKFKNYEDNHNEFLIKKCLIDSQGDDKLKLELLFNMTYSEYLDFYCGKKKEYKDILNKIITLEQYCESEEFKKMHPDYDKYKKELKNYAHEYKNILYKTNERRPKKNKKLKDENK